MNTQEREAYTAGRVAGLDEAHAERSRERTVKRWTLDELHERHGEWVGLGCPGAAEWQDDVSALFEWLGGKE